MHSFHSQVCETLVGLKEKPDVVVSFDSHVDFHMAMKELLEVMPEDVQLAATRASALTLIRQALGGFPALLKVQGFPTRSIPEMRLVVARAHVVFDLDVDYLQEMQTECCTPLKNTQPGQLGSVDRVLRLVRKAKPFLITVSEAKVASVRDTKSSFSKMMDRLEGMGYEIKHARTMFPCDEEAERLLGIYEQYDKLVQKPLDKRAGVLDQKTNELREATRRYFESL